MTDGTCTTCTSAVAAGCTAVTCAANKFDNNGDATDGCEASYSCASVTDGIAKRLNAVLKELKEAEQKTKDLVLEESSEPASNN